MATTACARVELIAYRHINKNKHLQATSLTPLPRLLWAISLISLFPFLGVTS